MFIVIVIIKKCYTGLSVIIFFSRSESLLPQLYNFVGTGILYYYNFEKEACFKINLEENGENTILPGRSSNMPE